LTGTAACELTGLAETCWSAYYSFGDKEATKEAALTMAVDLLQRHLQTLVAEPEQWQTLIADDIVWELAYAPALGHPARLSGRGEVMRHVAWFLGAVENFRFFDARYYAFADPPRRGRRSEGRGPDQVDRAHLPSRLCALAACCRRQNRILA